MVSDFENKVECILLGGVDEMVTNVSKLGDGEYHIIVKSRENRGTCEPGSLNLKVKTPNC